MAGLMICWTTPRICAHVAHTLMHSLRVPSLQHWLLSWTYRSGRRGEARTGGLRLPCPELPPWLSHSLAHSFLPTQSARWPGPGSSLAGGNAWFERVLVRWRKDFFLLLSPQVSLSFPAPNAQSRPGRQAGWLHHPLFLAQLCCHVAADPTSSAVGTLLPNHLLTQD